MLTHCAIMRRVKDFLKTKCDNEKPIPTKKNPQIIMFLKYFLDEKKVVSMNREERMTYLKKMIESGDYDFFSYNKERKDISFTAWKDLTKQVFKTYGKYCLRCGTQNNISVDHVKPYSKHRHLATDFNNLQPLCRSCNSAKGTKSWDFRKKPAKIKHDLIKKLN